VDLASGFFSRMFNPLDYPIVVLVVSFLVFWFAAWIGSSFRRKKGYPEDQYPEEFRFILGSILTLLGLIIGFTFSMALSRYDQRKNYEEQEANAIGTEYVRADLLPSDEAAKLRTLLRTYLDQRILLYKTRRPKKLRELDAHIEQLQVNMWSVVAQYGASERSPVTALVVSGMNDVLNSQSYTQASWWNRIPTAAWAFMIVISIFCNLLIGYATHKTKPFLFLVLPVALSISFFLIADIDSPRGGAILVRPQNLESLANSLRASK
jgi:hypothetical protein